MQEKSWVMHLLLEFKLDKIWSKVEKREEEIYLECRTKFIQKRKEELKSELIRSFEVKSGLKSEQIRSSVTNNNLKPEPIRHPIEKKLPSSEEAPVWNGKLKTPVMLIENIESYW